MVDLLKLEIPVIFLCTHFDMSTSSYYNWKKQEESRKVNKRDSICRKIKAVFELSRNTYGSPRIYQELLDQGEKVSENTVAKYMREMNLDARLKKKFRVITTDSNHDGPIAPRRFKAEKELPEGPYEILAGDITYLRMGDQFLYLAVVMDLYNREIVGWSISRSLQSEIVVEAMKMALLNAPGGVKIIFHSDRGSQYASDIFKKFLNGKEVIPSMSRKGNCYDNCYMETWFKSLKSEWIYRRSYSNEEELRMLVFEYIETWYNTRRRHSSLGYKSPLIYKCS